MALREVPYPDEPCTAGHVGVLPHRMPPGTYAIRPLGLRGVQMLEDRYYVLSPGDVRGTDLVLARCHTGCWGLDGRDGPNLACASCAADVGVRLDDCQRWQETLLIGSAVHLVAAPAGPGVDIEPYPEIPGAALHGTRWSQADAADFYRDEVAG
ncbi:hypothetical protein [Nocardia sp. NPDC048505]|uniref:hypothetical protein n=1 Tax=unclassified Nocardia TaxID=2637762 RepID=UPI0033ED0D92